MSASDTAVSPLRIAIIGSGPAAFYAAEYLLKQAGPGAQIDMIDRLPTPYGLVRGNPLLTAIEGRGVNPQDVQDAVAQKIGECFGVAPLESTMQAFVWRAIRE